MIFKTTPEQKLEVYEIAGKMKAVNEYSAQFIAGVVELALDSQGIYDLMKLWTTVDGTDRAEIVADLQDMLDESSDSVVGPLKKPKVNFKDFDLVLKDVVKFKAHLKNIVDQRGGISHLSRISGIPQPSLSRFFSSRSMPRRTTLYKIANALDLDQKDIVSEYTE